MESKKKIFMIVGITISMVFVIMISFYLQVISKKIVNNVYVENVNISNMTKEEAIDKVENEYIEKDINIKYNEDNFIIKHEEISFLYDIESTVQKAYNINRSGNIIENIYTTLKINLWDKQVINIDISYDEKKLDNKINEISKEINEDVKNASINIKDNKVTIENERNGVLLDNDKTKHSIVEGIKNNTFKVDATIKTIKPDITKDDLKSIDTILGTYTTKFNSTKSGRSHNIELASNSISNVLLMPNEVFSYNEYTGKRSEENGYKNAPVIVEGVIEEGIGGGVCQVSSTLYNAVLYSGIEILNVQNHSIPSTYVDKGRDATVTDSGIDFVFKNNYKNPIYIYSYVDKDKITCQIYGSNIDKKNIDIITTIDKITPGNTKKVKDPTLHQGEEKEIEKSRDGYKVSTYRFYNDSKEKIKVATSYYPKKQGIVAIGSMQEDFYEE